MHDAPSVNQPCIFNNSASLDRSFFQSLKKWGRNWKYLFYLPNTITSGLMSGAKKYEFAYLILLKRLTLQLVQTLKREFFSL